MSTDFIAGGYSAIKTLILADSWLTTAGNGVRRFVWLDGSDPTPDSRLPRKADGDVAELHLEWVNFSDQGRTNTSTPTMGNRVSASCPYIGTQKIEYEIRVVNRDTRITPVSAITTQVLDVLKSGATLSVGAGGTARLGDVTARSDTSKTDSAAGGTERRIVKIRVPVSITYQG